MRNLRFATVFTLLAASSLALAQAPSFDTLDGDGNGYISAKEASALSCLAENFDKITTESPEGLNRSEYTAAVNRYCSGQG